MISNFYMRIECKIWWKEKELIIDLVVNYKKTKDLY